MASLPFLSFMSGAVALGNAPAVIDDAAEGWVRYGDLRDAVTQNATILHGGDTRGLVLCAAPRTINGAIAYLAAAAAGHAIVIIDPASARPDLFIDAYEPEWVILASTMRPSTLYDPVDWTLKDLYLWRRSTPSAAPVHPDLFLLLLPPSAPDSVNTVRLSYHNIQHNTLATISAIGADNNIRTLLQMPLAYSFGLSLLHMTLSVGGSVMLTELDIKNRVLWDLVARRDVTLFAGIPFHYEYFARAGLANLHVPKVKTFLQAGGKMSAERTQDILRQITARNGALFIMYGQTEASPRMTCLPLHLHPEKAGSYGRAIDGGRIESVNGQLFYRGPNVMLGYASARADLAHGDTQGGALPIPSPARLDEEGFLYLD